MIVLTSSFFGSLSFNKSQQDIFVKVFLGTVQAAALKIVDDIVMSLNIV